MTMNPYGYPSTPSARAGSTTPTFHMVCSLLSRPPRQSVILAHFLPAFLDFLGLLFIQAGEFVARFAHHMQHLVELGMDSLRVAVLRALNDQRHEPSRQRGTGVPLESFRCVQPPKRAVAE